MNRELTVGKPESVLWRFCLPLLGSVLFQQMYNIADSLIAGRFAGVDALAAVGNSYEITLIYLAFAFGCNMGCSVIVSQLFGAKNYRDMRTAIFTTFIFSGILCALLMISGFMFSDTLLHLIRTPENIFIDSKKYLDIYTLGIIFLFFYNICTGIFSAFGDSKTPFIFLACSSVANVIADIIFVKLLNMGVAGVAWATFICQGISCILSMIVVKKRISAFCIENNYESKTTFFSFKILKKILKIALPSTLQQGCISIGNILIQGKINFFGSDATAGYAAAIKLNNMIITMFTALGNGMSNFAAQNIGAGKKERIGEGLKAGLKMAFIVCVIVVSVYMIFTRDFVRLFMDEDGTKALSIGVSFLRIVVPFYFVISVKLACDGVLRGIGAMKQFMTATFTDLILRVILAYTLSGIWGTVGIWLAWPIGWIVGTVLSVIFYRSLLRRINYVNN